MRSNLLLFMILANVLLVPVARAEEPLPSWSAIVIRVYDGDSFTVLDSAGVKTRIRLYGVDCPEIEQPLGVDARDFVAAMILGKTVAIEFLEIDKYGRAVGYVYRKGESVGEKLMKSGLAWVYEEYCHDEVCNAYRILQEDNIKQKRGIWGSEVEPVVPSEWRHKKRMEMQNRKTQATH